MRMPTGIVAKCLDHHDNARNSKMFAQNRSQKFRNTLRGTLTQLPEQFPVIKKELAKDLWYTENVLAMWDRENNRFFEMMGKLNHLFAMT